MDFILNYLVEMWPSFIIIVITAVVVWIFSRWYHRFVKVEGTIKELPCSKHDDLYLCIVETEKTVKEFGSKFKALHCFFKRCLVFSAHRFRRWRFKC